MADESYSNPELEKALRSAPISDEAKSQAWDAFVTHNDPQKFYDTFNGMAIPRELKQQLREMKFPQSRRAGPPVGGQPQAESAHPKDQPWYQRAILPLSKMVGAPKPEQSKPEQFARGAAQGALEGVEQLTTPKNLGLMGAMAGGSMIPVVGQILDIGAGAIFSGEMAYNLVHSIPELREAYKKGDWATLGRTIGQDSVDALLAFEGGRRTVGKVKGRMTGIDPNRTAAGANRPAGSGRTTEPGGPRPEISETTAVSTDRVPEPGVHGHTSESRRPDVTGVRPAPPPDPNHQPTGFRRPIGLPAGDQPLPESRQLPAAPPGVPETTTATRMTGVSYERPPVYGKGLPGQASTPEDVRRPAVDRSVDVQIDPAQEMEIAKSLPREVLARNVQQMRGAAQQEAVRRLSEAQGDPAKQAELQQWLADTKARIDRYQSLLGEAPPGMETGVKVAEIPPPQPKGSPKPPVRAVEAKRPDQPPIARGGGSVQAAPAKPVSKPAAKPAPKPEAPAQAAAPTPAVEAPAAPEEPAAAAEAPVAEPAKPEITAGEAFSSGIGSAVKRIFDTAKEHELDAFEVTIPRGGGAKPLVFSINTEFDTPEEVIAKISKVAHNISGMATVKPLNSPLNLKWSVELRPPAP